MGITKHTGRRGDYVSYLLRMWQDGGDEESPTSEESPWRASLQSPHSGDLVGFASLDDLFDFLRGQVGLQPAAKNVQHEA
jgi:hypothetical protein